MVLPGPSGIDQPIPVYRPRTSIPLIHALAVNPSVVEILRDHHIPAFRLGNLRSKQALDTLKSFNANVLICACFPHIIPRALTGLYPGRAINIHPSLLPDKRGPDPLFWTFRDGRGRSGVTIHELSPHFDAGAIRSQQAHTYPDGTTENKLEESLASAATAMTLELLPSLIRGVAQGRQQNEETATYAPFPRSVDFRLESTMSARVAFNFVRGIQGRRVPISIEHQGAEMTVVDAIRFTTDPEEAEKGATPLEFSDGYLIARLRRDDD